MLLLQRIDYINLHHILLLLMLFSAPFVRGSVSGNNYAYSYVGVSFCVQHLIVCYDNSFSVEFDEGVPRITHLRKWNGDYQESMIDKSTAFIRIIFTLLLVFQTLILLILLCFIYRTKNKLKYSSLCYERWNSSTSISKWNNRLK